MAVLRPNKLRGLMRKGLPTLGTHIASSWPAVIEVAGHSGAFDYVEFTSISAPYDLFSLENMARASELFDMSSMIKIDLEPKHYLAQRSIAAGFQSILFSDIRTIEDVHASIRAVRAEPKGWNGAFYNRIEGYVLPSGTDKFVQYADDVVVAIMIEKKSLFERVEDVMNTEGVDMVQFGATDFSLSMGIPGQYTNPKLVDAEEKTIKLALKYDKHPRGEVFSTSGGAEGFQKRMKRLMELGIRDFCVGSDLGTLFNWMKEYGTLARTLLSS